MRGEHKTEVVAWILNVLEGVWMINVVFSSSLGGKISIPCFSGMVPNKVSLEGWE